MDYLYNKKRLTILDFTREDQTLWQTKEKLDDFYDFITKRGST